MSNRLLEAGRASLMLGLAAFVSAGCGGLTLRGFFVNNAYPKTAESIPPRDLLLSVDASVAPALIVAYQKPHEAATCLDQLASDDAAIDALTSYGACLAKGGAEADCSQGLPWIPETSAASKQPSIPQGNSCPGQLPSALDQMRMYLSLGDAARALYDYHLDTRGQAALGKPLKPELSQAFRQSLRHASQILALDPKNDGDPRLPTFAQSGGAANGAFMAGYTYGLFWLREKARLYATPEQKSAIDSYRFGGAATSSVGTLVALALDLYFSDQAPTPPQERALDACIEKAGKPVSGDPGRKLQDCALAQLKTNFRQNEWDLLCAQEGDVLTLLGDEFHGLLRFDPMADRILWPFFRDFKDILLGNNFIRTPLAVDMNQAVLVGLDERACRMRDMDSQKCLMTGTLSSIIEPIFAAPLDKVYSGLEGPGGESGTWIDGSIRSLNPAARGATFGAGKLLVLNPSRSEGIPSKRITQFVEQFLQTTDALGASQRSWEIAYAAGYQKQRHERACVLAKLTSNFSLCPEVAPSAPESVPAADPGGDSIRVWVPEDIEPKTLFASGYTFDPLVMSALFAWGQQQALLDRKRIFGWLGWCAMLAMEDGAVKCDVKGVSTLYRQRVDAHKVEVRTEVDGYRKYSDKVLWQRHLDERRRLLKKNFKDCD